MTRRLGDQKLLQLTVWADVQNLIFPRSTLLVTCQDMYVHKSTQIYHTDPREANRFLNEMTSAAFSLSKVHTSYLSLQFLFCKFISCLEPIVSQSYHYQGHRKQSCSLLDGRTQR